MREEYKVLNYKDFFNKYKDRRVNMENSRFTERAYSQTNNCVSLFKKDLEYDCYVQCPDYNEDVVPEERRYIYVLRKGAWRNLPHTIKMYQSKEKVSININELEVFADPYFKEDVADIVVPEKNPLDWFIGKMKEVVEEYEKKYNK